MTKLVRGVLQKVQSGNGFLRTFENSFRSTPADVRVSKHMIEKFSLVEGVMISGYVNEGSSSLAIIESASGLSPEEFKDRKIWKDLTAVNPEKQFILGSTGDTTMRIMDLITPLGRGTRALIVSPPKSGKTTILEKIAHGIRKSDPDIRIIVLLVDERPEEVTQFRRSVDAEVLASTNDQDVSEHTALTTLLLKHARVELECGNEMVILVDSLTRMSRAYNLSGRGSGKTMSGGVDARAMEIPRQFFGMARATEEGGSLTIVATALVDTGSRMDQFIFEEFKGTGNSEIVLDRKLAEARLYPAIDLAASGTRRDELMLGEELTDKRNRLIGSLDTSKSRDSLRMLLDRIKRSRNNQELLASFR
jgi:transcription termination factor Rho